MNYPVFLVLYFACNKNTPKSTARAQFFKVVHANSDISRSVERVFIFLTIKPSRCTNFSNLLCNKTLHISDSFSVHHQDFLTANTAMVYGINFADS